ncbi:hypothetical protein [Gryllotalpicola koreensis]|uniref:Uncharacterized protein n=1 Tax=Gryllotalpicola koreensis TaxID=993086 RepID=A0ABP8ACG9_9MICO
MNQIVHHHHTLDAAEGPDLDDELVEGAGIAAEDSEDDTPITGTDAVANPDAEDPFD